MAASIDVLKGYLSKYKYKDQALQDINRTIQKYRDLRPSSGPFVFNDGSEKQLVHLDGTIPVQYKGGTYNIPIEVWILDTHPYHPPIMYVRPTSNMKIKPGKYVDANGNVDLPYIKDWKYPSSDLLSLTQILKFTFEEECPTYSTNKLAHVAHRESTPNPYNSADSPTKMADAGVKQLVKEKTRLLEDKRRELINCLITVTQPLITRSCAVIDNECVPREVLPDLERATQICDRLMNDVRNRFRSSTPPLTQDCISSESLTSSLAGDLINFAYPSLPESLWSDSQK